MFFDAAPVLMGGGVAAVAGTTWSDTNKAADWSLSPDKLTATHAGTNFTEARATTAKSSNASFSIVRQAGTGDFSYAGLNIPTAALGALDNALYVDMRSGSGSVFGGVGAIALGDVVLFGLSSDGAQAYVKVNGVLKSTASITPGSYIPFVTSNNSHAMLANFNPSGSPAWA